VFSTQESADQYIQQQNQVGESKATLSVSKEDPHAIDIHFTQTTYSDSATAGSSSAPVMTTEASPTKTLPSLKPGQSVKMYIKVVDEQKPASDSAAPAADAAAAAGKAAPPAAGDSSTREKAPFEEWILVNFNQGEVEGFLNYMRDKSNTVTMEEKVKHADACTIL